MGSDGTARTDQTPGRTSVAAAVGAAAGVGTVLAIVGATALAPWFSWSANALSDLGVAGGTAPLFNGALICGGLLALPYAWALHREGDGQSPVPAVTFALAMLSMAGVGAFPAGTPLHFPMALAFYLLLTVTLVADGVRRRQSPTGRAALVAAAVHVLGWAAWLAGVRPGPGLALPELLGALLFVGWAVAGSPVAPIRPSRIRRAAR
ncbi:DUF998 domain-containing protein [Halorarum halophilum]|uniref:DUF998 domain-containing protein n=1 Tax=Halorarum halophilum TaxID=2743090 RepID=A0A7D5KDN7_9EURY|nr:DUF998 domain-containing protein [Halobaculum halophilum]QLG27537.1 DUF998 domain-containing protein [Halobaculum halophilum]